MFAHIPWPAFLDLPPMERARVVAHYRTHNLVESWQNWSARQAAGTK